MYTASSPDGETIAFTSNRIGNHELYVMRSDGRDVRRLTNIPDQEERYMSWSPDGSRLVIEILDADTSDGLNLSQVTSFGSGDTGHATWSPNGDFLTFEGLVDGQRQIFVSRSDGSEARAITDQPGEKFEPTWSPRPLP